MTRFISELTTRLAARVSAMLLSALTLGGCAGLNDLVPQDKIGTPISGVGHYGRRMGVPEFSIDGHWGGNVYGWGGGGGTVCCVLLPEYVTKPMYVTVKWQSCDISRIKFVNGKIVNPKDRCILEDHQARVPINFDVQPAKGGSGLYVHFLPGHEVEIWYSKYFPESQNYPGPLYPQGPAPEHPERPRSRSAPMLIPPQ